MPYTYNLPLSDTERVINTCCSVAQSFVMWGEVYGVHFESIVNNGDGTLSVTFSDKLPDDEERSTLLVVI